MAEQPEAKDVSEIGEALIQLDLKVDKKCLDKVTRTNSKVFDTTVTKIEPRSNLKKPKAQDNKWSGEMQQSPPRLPQSNLDSSFNDVEYLNGEGRPYGVCLTPIR